MSSWRNDEALAYEGCGEMLSRVLAGVLCVLWAAEVSAGHGKIVAVPHGSDVPDGAGQ